MRNFPSHCGILASLALLASLPVCAQLVSNPPSPSPASLRFGRLGVDNGVSHPTVWDVLQDRQGFLWLGTESSLQRYDGYELRDFQHDPRDPHSLSASEVMILHEDRAGGLWLGTRASGVNRYDAKRGTFERFHLRGELATFEASGPSPSLSDLATDSEGKLWVATNLEGIIRLDPSSRRLERFRADPAGAEAGSLSSDQVTALLLDSRQRMWVAHLLGVDRYDAATGRFEPFRPGPPGSSVLVVGEEGDQLWVVTGDGGFYELVGEGFEHRFSFPSPCQVARSGPDGAIWCGTADQGLYRYDRRQGTLVAARHQAEDRESLSSDYLLALRFDRSGLLWIASRDGLSFYNPRRAQFEVARRGRLLPATSIASILVDSRDQAYMGSLDGELVRWDPRRGELRLLAKGLPTIDGLLETRAGEVMVGTNAGLYRLDAAREALIPVVVEGLTGTIKAMVEDGLGHLWLAGSTGLHRLDADRRLVPWPRPLDEDWPQPFMYSMLVDRQGFIWVGGPGLYRIDPRTLEAKAWHHHPSDETSLPYDQVGDLLEDSQGRLWVGTYGGGLALFDREKETFRHFGARNGLADDRVCGLIEGPDGELWVGTNRGLSRFDPETRQVRNYDSADGLASDVFLLVSRGKFSDGRLAFGGHQGLTSFYPKSLENDRLAPPVVLTELRVGGEVMEPGLAGSPLQQTIVFARRLQLDYRQRSFAIQFAAPHFANPKKNHFAYRLRGYEEGWTETGAGDRRARYTNLDPGTYTFEVRAANADGVWNEEGTHIEIYLPPAPWQTPSAYALYVAVLAAALFGYNRWQRRRLEHERAVAAELARLNGELERLVEKRTSEVHQLTGLLPVCSCCKKIRNSEGNWQSLEAYLNAVADVKLSHGLCRDCARTLYPDIDIDQLAG